MQLCLHRFPVMTIFIYFSQLSCAVNVEGDCLKGATIQLFILHYCQNVLSMGRGTHAQGSLPYLVLVQISC